MSLSRLKWLTIVAPAAFLAIVTYLLRGPFHEQFHEFPGYLYVLAVLMIAVSAFSFFVFGIIARLERRVLEQNEQLSQRNQELAALLAVGQATSSSLQLGDVLDEALAAVLRVTSAEAAEVWLTAEEGELRVVRQRGAGAEALSERTRLRRGEGLPGAAALSGSPVVVHDLSADPRCVRPGVTALGFESFGAFPLAQRGETVGVLAVAARSAEALSSDAEQRLLEGIGEHLAIAIENARLHERVLDGAVLEERERLARELHDGLAQVLGYVNTQALAIKKLLASGRREEAQQQVAEMEATAKRVYTDVREAVLGLRATQRGLLPSLRAYLADYARIEGTAPHLEVSEAAAALNLPGSVEIQLIRIVQEALTNVRKHADASSVTVRLRLEGDELAIHVEDDGRGFDLDRPVRTGWPHFGLTTMRERAQAVGGSFELVSSPGQGTKVIVRAPLEARAEVGHASLAGR